MDTPNHSVAGEATAELPQVCAPTAGAEQPGAAAPAGSGTTEGSGTPAAPATSPAPPVRRDPGAATTANLRAGLAARLRSAYERGADLADLARASHQSVAEVEQLLRLAGTDPGRERPTGVRGGGPGGAVPAPRTGGVEAPADGEQEGIPDGAVGGADAWRPSPVRPRPRIRRPVPTRRGGLRSGPLDPRDGETPAEHAAGAGVPTDRVPAEAGRRPVGGVALEPALDPALEPTEDGEDGGSDAAEPPLGILIGGPRPVPGIGTREEQRQRRVTAQLIRVGRGTTLAVLPSWRPSIAISVPTEVLLEATGLGFEELGRAELTVLINTEALHDRELRARDWQLAPEHGGGRRRRS
ncbi:hypothetical protein [Kitasatospora sp. LaBMicrA B282]|uniref:hypothetical protein n=1 Tax=Kitasatospora sp. LaBMicrA B282 TaxID=3420949 RepID=UPI003D0A6259